MVDTAGKAGTGLPGRVYRIGSFLEEQEVLLVCSETLGLLDEFSGDQS